MNKQMLVVAVLMIVGLFVLPSVVMSQETSINSSILNIKVIVANIQYEEVIDDSTSLYLLDANYHIRVSGAPTYTFQSREIVPAYFKTNQLNTINNTIETAIQDHAKNRWNWTLPASKIAYQPFTKGT